MRQTLIVGLILLLVAGCSDKSRTIPRLTYDCHDKHDQVSAFILSCIESANPKSDEEPEDWIGKCEDMAERTYCTQKTVMVEQFKPSNSYWRDVRILSN